LTCCAEHHERSSSELLDGEDGDPGRHPVLSSIARSEQSTQESGQTDVLLEDCCSVVGDNINARYLKLL